MIIMKFGGTSLANSQRLKVVKDLIEKSLHKNPIVVVSAHSGMTDALINSAHQTIQERKVDISLITGFHKHLLKDLGLSPDLLEHELTELQDLLRGIHLVRELTARSLDYVMSFGERMSSQVVASYLNHSGLKAKAFNAYDLGLITDENFGKARHLESSEPSIAKILKEYDGVPIITGFLGKTKDGEITTLGRSGSDYTASIMGSAVSAQEIQILTDVDGIMSADPRVIPTAISIQQMSFEEASELAYYGAKVIHPSTMLPAIKKNIPIRVLNTYNPDHPGTLILKESPTLDSGAKAIAYRKDLLLINIVSTHMLQQHGFMAKVFEIFAKYKIVLDMIATSEVSVSMTTDCEINLSKAAQELSEFGEVIIEKEKAILWIVGEGLKHTIGIGKKIFTALADADINVEMISQGATKINMSILVSNQNIQKAVQILHRVLFLE